MFINKSIPISRYAEHLVPGYTELAVVGKSEGFLVFGHDHVGHGLSEGERALVGDMGQLTDPVIQHCREKGKENSGVPLLIIRHSQGGLIHCPTQHPSALPLPSDGEAVMFIL